MKDMKFRVESPEHSEAIQKELFRLGYIWLYRGVDISLTEWRYMFANSNTYIQVSNNRNVFIDENNTETTLEDLKQMK